MLQAGFYYHIYNRGIDGAKIFFSESDYQKFLNRYHYYLGLSVETYAYSLLQNHFHILIRLLPEEQVAKKIDRGSHNVEQFYILPKKEGKVFKAETLLGHFFNSYTKYINSKYGRSGALMEGNFKRKEIQKVEYLQHCICYINRNPMHHGLAKSYDEYPHSSYTETLNSKSDLVNIEEVIKIFGDLKNFKAAHKEVAIKLETDLRFEEI